MTPLLPVRTPLVRYAGPGAPWAEVWLKDETAQVTGAFKFRGNLRRMATFERGAVVVTASTGNHGAGLATAARLYGLQAVVVAPAHTPVTKLDGLRRAGARTILLDGDYTACEAHARAFAAAGEGTFVSSFDDAEIIRGHGSLCQEVDESGLEFDVAVVPVGGGGLIAACLTHWGGVRVVEGVESDTAPALARSLAEGRRVCLDAAPGMAEGLLVRQVGELPFRLCVRHAAPVHLVGTAEIEEGIRRLWRHNGIRAEGAGAAALAAALAHPRPGGRCLCVVSGGNIDDAVFARVVGAAPNAEEAA